MKLNDTTKQSLSGKRALAGLPRKSLIALLALTLFSCSDIQEQPAQEQAKSADGETYLVVSCAGIANENGTNRTINPVITDEMKNDIINSLYDFKLTAIPVGKSDAQTLLTASSYAELTSAKIPITAGEWRSMRLSAYLNIGTTSSYSITYSETKSANVTIKAGEVNPISFGLTTSGYAGLAVTVNFEGNADKAVATVKSATKNDLSYSSYKKKTYTDFTEKEIDGKTYKSFTYTLDRANTYESLSTSTYYLQFEFYKTGLSQPLNAPGYFINTESGFVTETELTVKLNDSWTIEYKFFSDGTELTVAEGETLPSGVTVADGDALPGSIYSRKTAATLPDLEKENATFDGWFTDSSFAEDKKITQIAKGTTGNLSLYAKFTEESGGGTTDFVTVAGGTISSSSHVGTIENETDGDNVVIPDLLVSPQLVTQYEYEQLMTYYGVAKGNESLVPSETSEARKKSTPAYFVTWIDAIVYCNLRSEAEGLTPVYSFNDSNAITQTGSPWTEWGKIAKDENGKYYFNQADLDDMTEISSYDLDASAFNFNLSANGYRLPTTAEFTYILANNPDLITGETSGFNEWCQNYFYDYRRCWFDRENSVPAQEKYALSREQTLGFRVVRNVPGTNP